MSLYEYRPAFAFFVVIAIMFGAVMGSFLNCAAWRIVHGESFLKGRSHCPACGHELTAIELIPVLSWVIQRGRCRFCGQPVSIRYPLTELAFAVLTVICLLRFDLTVLCFRNYVFLCCLFLLTLTDLEDMTIPDECHIVAVLVWAVTCPFIGYDWGEIIRHILAGLVYGGGLLAVSLVMDRILGRDSLGGGDIKLFAVAGLYLGFIGTMFAVVISCAAGLIYHGLCRRHAGEANREFPFGPFIAFAVALILLFGEPLIAWYSGLLGI